MSPLAHPKGKTPSRSCNLRKGVFLRLSVSQSLSLWERWHCEAMTERASPAGKSRSAAIGRLFDRAILSLRQRCLAAALPSQSHFVRQLPQRGSPWHVGRLSSGRAKHNISEAAVLRCLSQRQLDKERCPEAAVPVSKARPFASCRTSGVQWKVIRPAKASPFGRGGIAKQ